MKMTHMGPTPCRFDKWNCQVFSNIKKVKNRKIKMKVRKDYWRIIFFLMAIKDNAVLSKLTSRQDIRNNNWIMLEFMWKFGDTFRELTQNNATHFLSEFISNNTDVFRELLPKNTSHFFQTSYHTMHFQGGTLKWYYAYSQSSYQTILTPPELLPNGSAK